MTLGREAAKALVSLRQCKQSVIDYTVEFRTIAAESGWNKPVLIDIFLHGLLVTPKNHMAPLDLPLDLQDLMNLAFKIDKRLEERQRTGLQQDHWGLLLGNRTKLELIPLFPSSKFIPQFPSAKFFFSPALSNEII